MELSRRLELILVSVVLFFGCQKETGVIDIHPKFQIYVDRFVDAASKRGKEIDFNDTGLSIQFRDAVDTETGGVCRGNHHIEIEKFYWDDLNDVEKEGLIYHELGHCELDRRHRNDTLPNGEWASRMRGDPIPEGLSAVINYSGVRRDYYIDELFNEEQPVPEFALFSATYSEVAPEQKVQLLFVEDAGTRFREDFILAADDNFEIEVEVDVFQSLSFVGIQFGGSGFENSFRIIYTAFKKLVIDSGMNYYGTMAEFSSQSVIRAEFNKITLRKLEDRFLVFINEKFIYWFEVPEFYSRIVESFRSGQGNARFRNLTISQIIK